MLEIITFLEIHADIIAAFAEVLAFITGVIAIPISIVSNKKAKTANQIAKESNSLSNTANLIANDSLMYSQASTLSRFTIRICSTFIENHASYAENFETFLREGRISVTFKVKNVTQNRALFAGFTSDDKKEKLRTAGKIIDPDKEEDIPYSFSIVKLIDEKPVETSSNGKTYKDTVYLHWDNGVLSCCCRVDYELIIEKYKNSSGQMLFRARTNTQQCEIGSYSFKLLQSQ